METVLTSLVAFIVAIAILVTVHEFGHFWVARKMGVRVLRFSIGFGKKLWKYQASPNSTEYVISALPRGGYVKMLDEREGEVPQSQLNEAFNRKSLGARVAVVGAGPAFNLIFAVLAYWLLFVMGTPGERPVIGEVIPDTIAATAGLQQNDEILRIDGKPTPSWEVVVQSLLEGAIDAQPIQVQVINRDSGVQRNVLMNMAQAQQIIDDSTNLLQTLGMRGWYPKIPPLIHFIESNGPAAQAGLRESDRIVKIDAVPVYSPAKVVELVQQAPGKPMRWELLRDAESIVLEVTPEAVTHEGQTSGRIGAGISLPEGSYDELRVEIKYGWWESVPLSVAKTWDTSVLILRMLGKMVTGQASLKNISGPVTIAEYAGKSASMGWVYFVKLLAFLSVSLGVLNLLPIPVLDGGHLFYYLVEFVKGSPLSEQALIIGQKLGLVALAALMGIAFFNDFMRMFG